MCGILGSLPGNNLNLKYLTHRGPDGSGSFIDPEISIGHTRLAILDLSIRGVQPKFSLNKEAILSYNGEIYNYRSLGLPNETCDTIALVEWLSKEGVQFDPAHIDGMYAFGVYFFKKKCLVLCRDPAGIKPIYIVISNDNQILGFSSEIKGFFGFDWFNPEPTTDISIQRDFLQFGYSYPRDTKLSFRQFNTIIPLIPTLLKNVFQICPGQKIIFSLKKEPSFYFTNFLSPKIYNDPSQILSHSIREQSISDVEVGVQLSGGIDSSLIAYEYAKQNTKVHGFYVSVDDNNLNEDVFAHHAAKIISKTCDFHFHQINATLREVKRVLPSVIWYMDEPPVRHPNALGIYLLCEYVKKKTNVKVLLTGEGADEVFGGYPWQDGKTITDYNKSRQIFDFGGSTILNKYFQENNNNQILYQQLGFDRKFYLPPILARQDRMSMAHSLESRVPFLSNNFLHMQTPDLPGKIQLKEIAKPIFGEKFVNRPKCGFGFPWNWLDELKVSKNSLSWLNDKVDPKTPAQHWALVAISTWSDFYLNNGWKNVDNINQTKRSNLKNVIVELFGKFK
jgi:asparagine synthase (glutamine-hydrolysing)